jgi:hypothetical protein
MALGQNSSAVPAGASKYWPDAACVRRPPCSAAWASSSCCSCASRPTCSSQTTPARRFVPQCTSRHAYLVNTASEEALPLGWRPLFPSSHGAPRTGARKRWTDRQFQASDGSLLACRRCSACRGAESGGSVAASAAAAADGCCVPSHAKGRSPGGRCWPARTTNAFALHDDPCPLAEARKHVEQRLKYGYVPLDGSTPIWIWKRLTPAGRRPSAV